MSKLEMGNTLESDDVVFPELPPCPEMPMELFLFLNELGITKKGINASSAIEKPKNDTEGEVEVDTSNCHI